MKHKKYQKVSDLVGKLNVKYDEDLIKAEVELSSHCLWSYARFTPVPTPEQISVIPLERRAFEGYRKGLAAVV